MLRNFTMFNADLSFISIVHGLKAFVKLPEGMNMYDPTFHYTLLFFLSPLSHNHITTIIQYHMLIHLCIYIYIYIYIHTYIHTCIYTYVYIYIYIHILLVSIWWWFLYESSPHQSIIISYITTMANWSLKAMVKPMVVSMAMGIPTNSWFMLENPVKMDG